MTWLSKLSNSILLTLFSTLLSTRAFAETYMPTQATDIAKRIDDLYGFLIAVSFIACAIVIGGMIYFALKYKRKSENDKTAYITHDTRLEVLWSVIPLIIFLVVFAWGWIVYHDMRKMPENALEIHMTGRQWAWIVDYKNGVKSTTLVVPVHRDIKIILTSEDVIHSLYIPSFRLKQDAVPGRYTAVWFNSDKLGEFHIFCAEFCGTSHSGMMTTMKVVTQEEFDKWLIDESEVSTLPIAQRGAKIFQTRACASCHNVDNENVKIGPSMLHKFGQQDHEVIDTDGKEVKVAVDENYVRESILNAQAKIAKGFGPRSAMPAFQGQLSEAEVTALIEYIKSLK